MLIVPEDGLGKVLTNHVVETDDSSWASEFDLPIKGAPGEAAFLIIISNVEAW